MIDAFERLNASTKIIKFNQSINNTSSPPKFQEKYINIIHFIQKKKKN